MFYIVIAITGIVVAFITVSVLSKESTYTVEQVESKIIESLLKNQ